MAQDDKRKSRQSEDGDEWRHEESFVGDGWYDASPTANAFAAAGFGEGPRADQVEIGPAGSDGPQQVTPQASFGGDVVVQRGLDLTEAPAKSAGNEGRALFERERSGQRGPHILNRSFAGTYPDED